MKCIFILFHLCGELLKDILIRDYGIYLAILPWWICWTPKRILHVPSVLVSSNLHWQKLLYKYKTLVVLNFLLTEKWIFMTILTKSICPNVSFSCAHTSHRSTFVMYYISNLEWFLWWSFQEKTRMTDLSFSPQEKHKKVVWICKNIVHWLWSEHQHMHVFHFSRNMHIIFKYLNNLLGLLPWKVPLDSLGFRVLFILQLKVERLVSMSLKYWAEWLIHM